MNWQGICVHANDYLNPGEGTDAAGTDMAQSGDGKPGSGSSHPSPSPVLMSNYRTSSQTIKATVGGVPTHSYRSYGVPTIRSDLPAPCIRRVSDHTVS